MPLGLCDPAFIRIGDQAYEAEGGDVTKLGVVELGAEQLAEFQGQRVGGVAIAGCRRQACEEVPQSVTIPREQQPKGEGQARGAGGGHGQATRVEGQISQGQGFAHGFSGPVHRAVPMAKYLWVNGGAVRAAYQMRQVPSGRRNTDWLVV